MAEGIARCGDRVVVIPEDRWQGGIDADVACFYGLEGNTPEIFRLYSSAALPEHRAVFLDLGYWGRREGGRWAGYHKVVVNDRHPNRYLLRYPMPGDRLAMFHVEPKPLREPGHHILLCGMSDKAARAVGLEPEEWELGTIAELRRLTTRPIVYRPKPSWKGARPLPGTRFSEPGRTLEEDLLGCHALVTRHSNCALEALLAGVPAHAEDGVAALLNCWTLGDVNAPTLPSAAARLELARNLAYAQWSIAEMREGLPWRHLRTKGLL